MLIHVSCPSCSEPYDIAETFAGGVYRCTKCNTLMSVPKTPAPRTNLAPGMSKSASPDDVEKSQSIKQSSMQISKSRPVTKTYGKKVEEKSLLETYKVHLISFGGLIVLLLIVLLVVKSCKKETKINTVHTVIGRAPEASVSFPFAAGVLTNDKPNVLGIPLSGDVMVVIDGGTELDAIRPAIHKLITTGLAGKPYAVEYTLIYASGESTCPSLSFTSSKADDAVAKTEAFLSQIKLTAKRDDALETLKPAFSAASQLTKKSQQLVLVTGRNLNSYWQNQLIVALDPLNNAGAHMSLVLIDANLGDMGDFVDVFKKSRGTVSAVSATAVQNAAK